MKITVFVFLATHVFMVQSHLEDYCVYNSSAANPGLQNFYKAAADLDCGYESNRPGCIVEVLAVSKSTFATVSPCRGMTLILTFPGPNAAIVLAVTSRCRAL